MAVATGSLDDGPASASGQDYALPAFPSPPVRP